MADDHENWKGGREKRKRSRNPETRVIRRRSLRHRRHAGPSRAEDHKRQAEAPSCYILLAIKGQLSDPNRCGRRTRRTSSEDRIRQRLRHHEEIEPRPDRDDILDCRQPADGPHPDPSGDPSQRKEHSNLLPSSRSQIVAAVTPQLTSQPVARIASLQRYQNQRRVDDHWSIGLERMR